MVGCENSKVSNNGVQTASYKNVLKTCELSWTSEQIMLPTILENGSSGKF